MSRTGPGELLVVLVDVGEHMRPYLATLHRMLFDTLNSKLFNKPRDEVAVVLYGTKGTRHALYDESDPDASFPHVTILRALEAVGSTVALEPFAFASDPPGAAEGEGVHGVDLDAVVDAGGRLDHDPHEALAARAARLLGPPGPRADWGDALTVAMDLLARALNERFAGAKKQPPARILLVSNLLARSEPMEDDFRQEMAEGCNAKGITLDVACLDHVPPAAAATDASAPSQPSQLPPELAAQRRANLDALHMLKAAMAPSMFRHLRQPGELLCLCRAVERTPNAAFVGSLVLVEPQQGAEGEEGAQGLELPVKVHKKTQKATKPSWKNYHAQEPHAADVMQDVLGEGGEEGPRQLIRDTQYKGPDGEVVPVESLAKALEYGKQLVPVTELEEAALRAPLEDKALKVVGFVPRERIMRHQFMKDVHVIVGNSDHAHLALSALARAMAERNVVGIMRAKLRRGMTLFMGVLTPALGAGSAVPDVLLLNVLPWAEDLRLHAFTTFRNEAEAADLLVQKEELAAQMRADRAAATATGTAGTAPSQAGSAVSGSGSGGSGSGGAPLVYEKLQPTPEQLDAAIALVQQLDLGPGPGGRVAEEALAPEATCNPLLHRMQAFIASKALDAHAQLPPEDELAQLVLEPRSALSYMGPEAAAALRRAEELLAVQERTELPQAPVAEAAAVDGAAADGAAAAASGGAAGGAAAAAAVVFDPSAAGGAATRVTRVSTANAEEDFKAMVAQGGESAAAAVAQMCDEVLPKLVSYSIGEQQYGKIAQCVDLLRTTCAKGGRAAAFNAFLPQLLDLCKRTERDALLQLLVATRGVTLISTQEAEAAGGGVEGAVTTGEAEAFVRRYREAGEQAGGARAGTGAGARAAEVVVVEDDDFGDME